MNFSPEDIPPAFRTKRTLYIAGGTVAALAIVWIVLTGGRGFGQLIVFAVFAVIAYFAWKAAAARTAAIKLFAEQHGWNFDPVDDRWAETFTGGPMGRGDSRSSYNVITGKYEGVDFATFDYRYSTGSGRERSTYTYGIALLSVGGALPGMSLTPETWANKIGFGDNFNTESIEFNKKYVINVDDKRTASAILNPLMLEYMLDNANPGYGWWIEKNVLATYTDDPMDTNHVLQTLAYLHGLNQRIPDWVRNPSQ